MISACAVGSLQEEFVPGDLVIADQFIDFTKKRDYTYFDDRIVHISIPDPFSPYLNSVFAEAAKRLGMSGLDTIDREFRNVLSVLFDYCGDYNLRGDAMVSTGLRIIAHWANALKF